LAVAGTARSGVTLDGRGFGAGDGDGVEFEATLFTSSSSSSTWLRLPNIVCTPAEMTAANIRHRCGPDHSTGRSRASIGP
jgi:hypothetical protein